MTGIIIGLAIGLIVGGLIDNYFLKRKIEQHKLMLRKRKKARQRRILERLRIEVKNNAIRLKKEEKRLALTKQLAPFELLFKNFEKRLYKVADKELMSFLQDFYKELIAVEAMNATFIRLAEKNLMQNEKMPDEIAALLFNYMASALLQNISPLIETGAAIVTSIEKKIQ